MHPLLLLAIIGGGAWILGRAKQSSDSRLTIRGGRGVFGSTGVERLVITERTEKFEDPLYSIYGAEDPYTIANERPAGLSRMLNRVVAMNDAQPDPRIGYEYLSTVRNDAVSRIGAIRARIRGAGVTPPTPGFEDDGTLLGKMVDASTRTLGVTARSLVTAYEGVSNHVERASAVASKLGVDTASIQREASAALSSAKGSVTGSASYAVMDRAVRDYGPIARTAVTAIARAVETGSNTSLSTQETAEQWLDTAGNVVLLIPVYGWIVGAALKGVSAILGALRGDAEEYCAVQLEHVNADLDTAARNRMPIPWRMFNVFSPDCDTTYSIGPNATSEGMMGLMDVALKNRYYTSDGVMPPTWQVHVQRWWAAAQTYAAHPRVHEVFAALGYDASGGTVASDEQVMLVAAPIAAMYGFDVDELAIALWKRSKGWRGAPEAFRPPLDPRNPDGRVKRYFDHVGAAERQRYEAGLISGGEGIDFEYVPLCSLPEWQAYCSIPHNAWWLQWGVLARDAFLIVEEWQKTRVLTVSTSAFGMLKGLKL